MIFNTVLILYVLPMILVWVFIPFDFLKQIKIFFSDDVTLKDAFKNKWGDYYDWVDFCNLYKYSLIPGFNITVLFSTVLKIICKIINWCIHSILGNIFLKIQNRISIIKFSQIKSFFKK